ncbi:helix-turn-helix transcriptional regulator [Gracilibacillus alcaliphilus]|uniref:helix-turn-helix transcriptional regulator n=1 Tax=Gracilibacillus alcaliphilus TaxID=1401441 RepID=UPI00195EE570|nr:AraC family transcriptional regulator [Gracilibacillus alcaliphilus]MBM7677188.1 AraC-like DNA-binding protein [Gracilibacillus alcaliphilus]
MLILDYCDYSCHNRDDDRIYRPNGLGFYLFLRFYQPMRLVLNDSVVFSEEGACILFTPEYPQDYSAIQEFQNSYVHFLVQEGSYLDYKLPKNEIFYPRDLEEIDQLFQKIQAEFLSPATYQQEMMNILLQQLLIESSRQLEPAHQTEEANVLYASFRELRFTLLTQCEKDWTIAQLCQAVHLEKSQFYTYYERFFNISPKADLLNARMNKAKQMLVNQAAVIQNVAQSCGFASASHFSRQFKRAVGCAPKEFQEKQL